MKRAASTLDTMIIFFLGLVFFTFTTNPQEIVGFESRFYLFALEMWRHGLSLFPTTYQSPYPDYLGTSTWLVYFSAKLFGGLTKFTAVLPTAIAASITLVLTYLLGYLHARRLGWYAAGFLLFTAAFFSQARTISLDMFVAMFTTLGFYLAYSANIQHKKLPFFWIMLCLGLSFMLRGPIGLVIPTGVLCVFYLLSHHIYYFLKISVSAFFLLLILCALLLSSAYYVGGADFFHAVLRMQIFSRMQGVSAPPGYFYFTDALGAYAITYPLAVLIVVGIAFRLFKISLPKEHKWLQLLAGWAFVILIGLSIPMDKKIRYVLAISPALALISAYLLFFTHENKYLKKLRACFYLFCFIFPAIILISLFIIHQKINLSNYTELVILFSAIQIIQIIISLFLKKREFIFALAVLTFMLAYIFIIEKINLDSNRSQDFVIQIENLRRTTHAKLIFYQEGRDGWVIKYLTAMPYEDMPLFINSLSDAEIKNIKTPVFIIMKPEWEKTVPAHRFKEIRRGKIGHQDVVIYFKKPVN